MANKAGKAPVAFDARYSAICGYTDSDVNTVFASELEGLDRSEIRRWYNGSLSIT